MTRRSICEAEAKGQVTEIKLCDETTWCGILTIDPLPDALYVTFPASDISDVSQWRHCDDIVRYDSDEVVARFAYSEIASVTVMGNVEYV